MEPESLSTAWQVVGTVLGSSIIAGLVGHYTVVYREDREFKLKKLEQLWRDADAHINGMVKHFADLLRMIAGGTVADAEIENDRRREDEGTYSELVMATTIYFQELQPDLERIESIKVRLVTIVTECATRSSGAADGYVRAGGEALMDLNREHAVFRRRIAAVAFEVKNEHILSPVTSWIKRRWAAWLKWLDAWENY